nr:CapA family protein [Allomuricauda sp.]
MNILIGGDVFLGGELERYAIHEPEKIWGDSLELFQSTDLSIVNLESPLTSAVNGISKTGPCIKASTKTIGALKAGGIDLLTLANNHILDYGEKGLQETLDVCFKSGIEVVGAGMNLQEAQAPFVVESEGQKIAILNIAENEWASAKKDQAGANPMNLIDNLHQIKEAKKNADVVILIIHGGHEFNPYPSPRMVKQYRFYAENGADVIVGHHTHCASGFETFKGVPIVYSLGNLVFHSESQSDNWFKGYLIKLDSKNILDFKIIPYHQSIQGIRLFSEEEKKEFFEKTIYPINEVIQDERKLSDKWEQFAMHEFTNRLFIINGQRSFLKRVLKKVGLGKWVFNRRNLLDVHNFFRCEAHYDLSMEVLNQFYKKR